MDRNTLLAIVLSLAVLTLWTMFTAPPPGRQQPPQPQAPAETTAARDETAGSGGERAAEPSAGVTRARPAAPVPVESPRADRIQIETPLFRAELDPLGAVLLRFELKGFRLTPAPDSPPIVLTTGAADGALMTPFLELGVGDLSRAPYTVERADDRSAAFLLERNGVRVRKVYEFDPEGYAFALRVGVENASSQPISPAYELAWSARVVPGNDFKEQAFAVLHDGSLQVDPIAARAARCVHIQPQVPFHRCLLSLGNVEPPTRGSPRSSGDTTSHLPADSRRRPQTPPPYDAYPLGQNRRAGDMNVARCSHQEAHQHPRGRGSGRSAGSATTSCSR
jgi:hypothetical protein